jgi:small neutral amino acid transporter SnatA (MarC family)
MEGWASYGAILDGLVKTRLPRLHRHMEAAGLTVDLYALQWFTTLFVKGLPFESTLRVWDIYLCEQHPKGSKILFRVALAVLAEGERELLTMHDLPQLVERIRQLPFAKPGLQGDKLIAKALSINLKTSDLFPPALPSSRSRGKA